MAEVTSVLAIKVVGLSLVSLAVSWFGARQMFRRAGRGAPIDTPNGRSSHSRPTVRGGGVGLALAICLTLLAIGSRTHGVPRGEIGLFAIATVIIAAIGLWADYRDPPASYRLFLQLGAAGLVLGAGVQLHVLKLPWGHNVELWWAAVPLTLLWIVSLTNLYNFIDGADGLATSLAAVYSAGAAAVAFSTHHPFEGVMAVAVLAACLGFLRFNFPPARLFMGDVGSLTLGFVFAVLAVRLATLGKQLVPMVFWLILYSSFLFDTSYTILYRAIRGEKFWQAHRSHLYERLLTSGWSHLQVTLFYVGLSLVSLVLAFSYLRAGPVGRTAIVCLQLLVCLGHLLLVKIIEGSIIVPVKAKQPGSVGQDAADAGGASGWSGGLVVQRRKVGVTSLRVSRASRGVRAMSRGRKEVEDRRLETGHTLDTDRGLRPKDPT
jgi:UDP-N-acetylmuramyl pentapeptide phosphotransferase/UDP-N-acetylglucosamine-1-phosphate transferase